LYVLHPVFSHICRAPLSMLFPYTTLFRSKSETSLWDRLGGEKNVRKVVDDLVALAAKDPKVNFDRNGKYPFDPVKLADFKEQMVDFISAASGGPLKYTGKSMKEVHKGMGITAAEFNAL